MLTATRRALLVAGMHRSGTSAMTRVFSLLGADLPENLAPALPDNNETGFWESADLMVLHDKLLVSAGSSWDDWTPFNREWIHSATGEQYRQQLFSVIQNDFADSGLFAVKDPRICRFLPFWLDLLHAHSVMPAIIIPVRNPLEVAHSLKARDGFPLAKSGMLWLRHVLDAVRFSANYSVSVVSYEALMTDWRGLIEKIVHETGVVFPRQSVATELEVEQYLDNRQKHNAYTTDDVVRCREFSPVVVSVYNIMQEWLDGGDPDDCREQLLAIGQQFDRESLPYAKLVQAQQVAFNDAGHKHQQSLAERIDHYEKRLTDQVDHYEKRLTDQVNHYEKRLTDQVNHYEKRLTDQVGHYDRLLLKQKQLNEDLQYKQLAEAESQLQAVTQQLAQTGHDWNARYGEAVRSLAYKNQQLNKLRKDFICLNERSLSEEVDSVKVLFDADWYLAEYPDLESYKGSAFEHYLKYGWGELRQPHPLFASGWYLQRNPDVADAAVNPLEHYVLNGGRELRDPHPLFKADYYAEQYPDALSDSLAAPLLHYMAYGDAWGCHPHPLFDPAYFRRQLQESVPAGRTLLTHYLTQSHLWYLSPSPAFDGDYYLALYPDVLAAEINPLLHYMLCGAADQRQPHPEADTAKFRAQYSDLFVQAGIITYPVVSLGTAQREQVSLQKKARSTLIEETCFNNMLVYTRQPLEPMSQEFTASQLTIHWVTCDFARKGGGGNMTIFRFIRLFELLGHRQHVWLHNKVVHTDPDSAYEDMVRNYQQTSAAIHFIEDGTPDFSEAQGDIIIATDWESVWPVVSARYFKRRFYFVQDHESSFFAAGGRSLASGMTYHEDLDCICAGPWLEKLMQERYGRWATKFWLAADQQVYYPVEAAETTGIAEIMDTLETSAQNPTPRVAFYARLSTSRRAVELGLLALDHLAGQGIAFHVDVYGSSDNGTLLEQARFNYTDHGILSAEKLGALYRECDVGLVFSATNYSLVPQEMMACGLAVLELDGDNTRSVFPEGVALLTKPHPQDMAAQLARLLTDIPLRQRIAQAGLAWAQQFDWASTAADVSEAIQQRLQDIGFEKVLPEPAGLKVSVVIPVLNGGDLLLDVLDKVAGQHCPWNFEILVIDSGSTDGTLEAMQQLANVRVHCIDKSTFSHGGTRNLGVELTAGEYIAFLTQDALPVDDYWLFNLVSVLEREPEAAGAFGRHLPYSDHSPFMKRDLLAHFENLGQFPLYLSKDTDAERFDSGDQGWRQVLHFYSDNNSCMRRSVWEHIPYPVIEYGEDQVWADQIIKTGFKKAYAINAVVYHSHDYDEAETYERSRTEAEFFRNYFGYLLMEKSMLTVQLERLNERDRCFAQEHGVAPNMLEYQLSLNAAQLAGYVDVEG